jgi:hypothetical protein
MAYLGRGIENLSDRVVLDSLTASATASYTLQLNSVNFVPSSAESLTVSLNGVIQAPISSYTVSGSTLTFASALTSSDSIDFIIAERGITLQTPSAGSVGTSQLASSAVTNAKIASDAAIATTKLGTGAVLQVVYDTFGSTYATSSSTYSDTGLTLNITPASTSNKILLMFTGRLHNQSAGAEGKLKFLRDSTAIWEGRTVYAGGGGIATNSAITVYDTPATTSQITYKIQGKLDAGSPQFMMLSGGDNDIATLTAMEIAG